jgi:hypothetical protein
MEDDSHVDYGPKSHSEKEYVIRCVVVMQQSVLLLPKLEAKS